MPSKADSCQLCSGSRQEHTCKRDMVDLQYVHGSLIHKTTTIHVCEVSEKINFKLILQFILLKVLTFKQGCTVHKTQLCGIETVICMQHHLAYCLGTHNFQILSNCLSPEAPLIFRSYSNMYTASVNMSTHHALHASYQ